MTIKFILKKVEFIKFVNTVVEFNIGIDHLVSIYNI